MTKPKLITVKLTEHELETVIGVLEQESNGLEKLQGNVEQEYQDTINVIGQVLTKLDIAGKG